MPTPLLMPTPRQRFVDNVGLPLANGMVFTFAAGTSDKLAAFQDPDGLIPHENPIRLDVRGEALIYWLGNYKVDVRTSLGIQLPGYPVDNYNAVDPTAGSAIGLAAVVARYAASSGSSLIGWIQTGVGAVATTVLKKLRLLPPDVEDFGAVGDGVADDWAAITKAFDAMAARGGNVTLNMKRRYRITKGLKQPSYVNIDFGAPNRYPYNNAAPSPSLVADFTDPNQWVIEPRTLLDGAPVPYNTVLSSLPNGATFNVGMQNGIITSVGVTPYGGIRIHGSPGAVVKNMAVLNTGIGILVNESFGSEVQVHEQAIYYGAIFWGEVNASSQDIYHTLAAPKPKLVPAPYLFPPMAALNGSMVGLGLSTEAHYNRPYGLIFGAQAGSTSSNNEISFTCEYSSGGIFLYNARSLYFKRLYVEGAAGEVDFGIVVAASSFSSSATHAFFSSAGTLLDIGNDVKADIMLNGVLSYATLKPNLVPNSSKLTIRGASMSNAGLLKPEINVSFPDDPGDWIAPTLLNGWTNAGGSFAPISYRLNPKSNTVELQGEAVGGADNQPVFVIPAGYRSLTRGYFPVTITGATATNGNVHVLATGELIPVNTGMAASGFDLKPVKFRAEQ